MDAKMTIKKRVAIVIAATGIMLSVGSGVALAANIQGTDKEDTLIGTPKDDTIDGLKSNDLLKGLPGRDHLDGGPNKDRLFGGADRDVLVGGVGADKLDGGKGNDVLRSAFDAGDVDRVFCGPGVDSAVIDDFDKLGDGSCESVTIRPAVNPGPVEPPAIGL